MTVPSDHETPGAKAERSELLAELAKARGFLRQTVRGITDDQARQRTTVSALCLGGIVKHVSAVERGWANFVVEGLSALVPADGSGFEAHARTFHFLDDETLEEVLSDYEEAAHHTDQLVLSLPDLEASQPLPPAPWFEKGATWSARRVVLHLIAETAQHAGHADIIRESLDGAKTMG
jgi:uncharacterized damage-inducible protein DinB